MREEYDKEGIPLRKLFWRQIHDAYKIYRAKYASDITSSLNELIDDAGPPPGLRGVANIKTFEPELRRRSQLALWEFCRLVYSSEESDFIPLFVKSDMGDTKLSKKEKSNKNARRRAEKFKDARSQLGGFWDRWTRRIDVRNVAKQYPKERHCVLLLSWFDIPHRRFTGEDDAGKQGMYEMAEFLWKQNMLRRVAALT